MDYKELSKKLVNNSAKHKSKADIRIKELCYQRRSIKKPEIKFNDEALNKLTSILKKIKVVNLNYINSGSYGSAYDIGNNKVLKITRDEQEILLCSNLVNKKIDFVAEYYFVGKSKYFDLGFIIMKRYKKSNYLTESYIYDFYDIFVSYYNFYESMQKDDNIKKLYKLIDLYIYDEENREKFLKLCDNYLKQLKFNKYVTKKVFISLLINAIDNVEQFNYLDISVKEFQFCIECLSSVIALKSIGINWIDDHFGNFAIDKYGQAVAIDIGASDSDTSISKKIFNLESISYNRN
jgi:hypothetical protein